MFTAVVLAYPRVRGETIEAWPGYYTHADGSRQFGTRSHIKPAAWLMQMTTDMNCIRDAVLSDYLLQG